MTTIQSFQRGNYVVPILKDGVVANDTSSPAARSSLGESEVIQVRGKGESQIIILRGRDGALHEYHAMYFRRQQGT